MNLVQLTVRARWKRALRWPLILLGYRRCGLSWASAWRMTHFAIWYDL